VTTIQIKKYYPEAKPLKPLIKYFWVFDSNSHIRLNHTILPVNNIDLLFNFLAPMTFEKQGMIHFSDNNSQNYQSFRQLSVDPDLAGVAISMRKKVFAKALTQPDTNGRRKRSKGIVGARDGIIFKLSVRETEVLRLITEGLTNKEIAGILKVSQNTINSYVVSLFNKLGVNDRTQAAVWAVQKQLLYYFF
jgi:DNA-binding CsgD family transcriptional regulator